MKAVTWTSTQECTEWDTRRHTQLYSLIGGDMVRPENCQVLKIGLSMYTRLTTGITDGIGCKARLCVQAYQKNTLLSLAPEPVQDAAGRRSYPVRKGVQLSVASCQSLCGSSTKVTLHPWGFPMLSSSFRYVRLMR